MKKSEWVKVLGDMSRVREEMSQYGENYAEMMSSLDRDIRTARITIDEGVECPSCGEIYTQSWMYDDISCVICMWENGG